MIVITGAGGFIGSRLVKYFSKHNNLPIVVVDDWKQTQKYDIIPDNCPVMRIHRDDFINWLITNFNNIEMVYHLGARTDTTEMNSKIFQELNINYSKAIWDICSIYNIPLIYASSAATYGNGEYGYIDDEFLIPKLKPLNPYGKSKQIFDEYISGSYIKPPYWAGLKFFNVFGYGEYNKGRMASVVYHGINQIKETGKLKLFRSHKKEFEDGQQSRDFIWVEDVVRILGSLFVNKDIINLNGIYNLGTGEARSFNDLGLSIFKALNIPPKIDYIDIPKDIRHNYQYYTCANMKKLSLEGIDVRCSILEDAVYKYVSKLTNLKINKLE